MSMESVKKLAVVVGIRSQYIKLAAVQPVLDRSRRLSCMFVDTGQHYDGELAGQYQDEYGLHFDVRLRCGSADITPTEVLARMIVRLEEVFAQQEPEGVLVFGDANSSLAAGLAARRLGLPLAHLEAGVRTGTSSPEELNRVVVDCLASLHMASTVGDLSTLRREGKSASSVFVGDVVRDLCTPATETARSPAGYVLVSLHREENTQDCSLIRRVVEGIDRLGLPTMMVLHPRVLRLITEREPSLLARTSWQVSVPHAQLLRLLRECIIVVTDSGAIQRESYYLGRRAVVVQDVPFWPSLVEAGFHTHAHPNGDLEGALSSALEPAPKIMDEFGEPGASLRMVQALETWTAWR